MRIYNTIKCILNLFLFMRIAHSFSRCEPEEPCSLCMFHSRDCLGKYTKKKKHTHNIIN